MKTKTAKPLHRFIPDAPIVARAFCEILLKWIGRDKLALVIARNQTPDYDGACASHDFCDANEAMDAAFKMVAGYCTGDTGGEGIGCMSEAVQAVWTEAWELAQKSNFNLPRLNYVVIFKLAGARRSRLYVEDESGAKYAIQSMLPAVVENIPIVKTRRGQIASILATNFPKFQNL